MLCEFCFAFVCVCFSCRNAASWRCTSKRRVALPFSAVSSPLHRMDGSSPSRTSDSPVWLVAEVCGRVTSNTCPQSPRLTRFGAG